MEGGRGRGGGLEASVQLRDLRKQTAIGRRVLTVWRVSSACRGGVRVRVRGGGGDGGGGGGGGGTKCPGCMGVTTHRRNAARHDLK